MSEKCPSCSSCGLPMEKPEDFSMGNPKNIYCRYCTDAHGNLLPYEAVLETNIQYYIDSQGITPDAANRMARALLASMPAWKSRAG
jgi:Putative zinc ribbon domain